MVKDNCKLCKKLRRLRYSHKICEYCYADISVRKQIVEIKRVFQPQSEYNKYLFDLYLKYIKRYPLRYMHLKQAKNFSGVLESRKLPNFTNWSDLREESKNFKLSFGKTRNSGCPFIKTGRMLEEIGVLSFKHEDCTHYLVHINKLSFKNKNIIESFISFLKTTKRSQKTQSMIIMILIDLSFWMEECNHLSILLANETNIERFLEMR